MTKRILTSITLVFLARGHQATAQSNYTPYTFTTLAGLTGNPGSTDGTGSEARFGTPSGVAVDSAGNVYVADGYDSTIRKVTPTGVVTTLAGLSRSYGTNDGKGSEARFNYPFHLAVDSAGVVYVTDYHNHTIRKLTSEGTNWVVTTIAGRAGSYGSSNGTGSDARFYMPTGVAVDHAGNLYVTDQNDSLRKVSLEGSNWVVTTIAGQAGSYGANDGVGTNATFNVPHGVAVDNAGNVYVTDAGSYTIRKVTPEGTNWVVTTIAGLALSSGSADGPGSVARFGGNLPGGPRDVAVDTNGNLYVADTGNYTIRKVMPEGTNWVVTTLAGPGLAGNPGGNDGTGIAVIFSEPQGVVVDSVGNVYVADKWSGTIRKGYPENVPAAIVISPPDPELNPDEFGIKLSGPRGQLVVVEVSTDLLDWLPIWTNTFDGDLFFSDPQSSAFSQRFYRALTP